MLQFLWKSGGGMMAVTARVAVTTTQSNHSLLFKGRQDDIGIGLAVTEVPLALHILALSCFLPSVQYQ